MAVAEQVITDKYALYCGDCMEVMQSLPSAKVNFSIYSPPFGACTTTHRTSATYRTVTITSSSLSTTRSRCANSFDSRLRGA